jgi:hypothetical protein
MAILSRLTIHLRPSIILCYVSAGGLLYVLYQNAAQLSTSQLHSSPQRRFLTFESGNSSCPATPPANTTQKFDFQGLYEYLQDIQKNCSKDDPRLVYQYDEAFLTLDAVRRWTGEHWKTWSPCPGNDILKRLLTWKFPLVNLLSQFGKQPLGIWREIATICHLIGDPIDTLASMFYTLHVCWLRVRMLKQLQLEPQDWKAVVLVMQAFDECSGQFAMLELEAR